MEYLQELTDCCICNEIFTDPRMLPCIHTFCLKCLQQTAVRNGINAGEKMPCPFCRREFVIPTEGLSGLQKNFFMDRLVEITKLSVPMDKATSCEICIEVNETEAWDIPTATNYCIQCHKNICNFCCRLHSKFPDSMEHEFLPLGSPMREELIQKYAATSCDKHNKEKTNLFCSDCKEVICLRCFAENHQLHKCNDIESSADSLRKQILDTMERVSSFSNSALIRSERLLKEKSDFLKNVERVETAVVTRGKRLKDLIDKCTQSLLDELNSIKSSHLKELETAKEENEFQQRILDSFKEYCRELTSKGLSSEMCRSALDINLREGELKQIHDIHSQKQITPVEVSFEASKLEELLKTENVVGMIKAEKDSEADKRRANVTVTRDDEKQEVSILSSAELDLPSCPVIGVTKLMHSIYILPWSFYAYSLYVFDDQNPFHLQKKIEINEINDPSDITAIEESKCLYITGSDCIWKMTADGHRVTKWMSNVNQPLSLSASNDGHLVVLAKDQASRCYVENYKSEFGAKLIRCLPLPIPSLTIDIQTPLHVVQSSTGEFIISHRNGRDGPWVISRLTNDGQKLISQCNLTDDRVSQQLNYPQHLTLDSDKNRLFVADDCRVSVFDSNSLILIKVLLTLEECSDMTRLHYDAKKKQLIVAQSPGNVNIYEIN